MKSHLIIATVYVLALLSAGCAVKPNANADAFKIAADKVTSGLVAIDVNANSLTDSLNIARAHADTVGQSAIDAALRSSAAILKTVADTQAQAAKESTDFTTEHAARVKDDAALKIERGQWWSDRQRAAFWTAVIIVAGFAVTLFVLDFFCGMGAPIASIANVLFHILTLGVTFITAGIGNFNDWLAAKFKKVAPVTVTATKLTPATVGAASVAPMTPANIGAVATAQAQVAAQPGQIPPGIP